MHAAAPTSDLSPEQLAHALLQAPAGIAVLRGEAFVFEFANPLYEEIVGRKVRPGTPLAEALPEVGPDSEVLGLLRGVMRTGETFVGREYPVPLLRHGQLEPVYFDFVYAPLRDAEGRVTGVLAHATDVTASVLARKRVEALAADVSQQKQALQQSEERLRLALDATALGTWDFHPLTGELRWDARCRELFGVPPEAPVGYATFLEHLHPDDRAGADAAVQRALDPGGPGTYAGEFRVQPRGGGPVRWCRSTGQALFAGRRAVRFLGTLQDVTALKDAESERARAHARERRRAEQLRGLADVALALNAEPDLERLLALVTERARLLVGAHQAITSLTEGANWAQAISAVSLSDKYAAWRAYDEKPTGRGIYAWVCEQGRPVRLSQAALEAHPRFGRFGESADRHPPLRGWLAAPLQGRDGRNIGLIQLSDRLEGDFTENDEAVLVQLAQLASGAVENAALIARQRATEERLREALAAAEAERQNLHAFFSQVPASVSVLRGPELRVVLVSPLAEQLAGRPLRGLTVREAMPELEGQGYVALLEQVYRTGEPFEAHELPVRWDRHGTGEPELGFFNVVYQPLRTGAGAVDGVVTFGVDVTEQVRARRAMEQLALQLQESEARFRTVVEALPQLVWTTRPDGYHEFFNRRWYEYTGLPEHVTDGEGWQHAFHPDDVPEANLRWRHSLATGEPYEVEYRLRRRDGAWRWMLGRAMPVRAADGRILQWLGTCTDIEDQKRAQEELRRAQEEIRQLNAELERRVRERTAQLEQANRELESFSYSVSHDLRAPLRHITGFAELLERRAGAQLDERARTLLATLQQAAQQGGRLVDDLLAFSRMGRAPLATRRVALGELVEEARRALAPDEAGRHVAWEVGPLPEVEVDPALLRQVLQNLLSNALKYTRGRDPARIEVGAREREGEVELWVRDNGVGFDPAYVHKLFGVFQRLHAQEQFEGTGIGLALVRRIVGRHGGRTWAEGRPGEGATFHLTLPRPR